MVSKKSGNKRFGEKSVTRKTIKRKTLSRETKTKASSIEKKVVKNITNKNSLLSEYHEKLQHRLKDRVGDFLYRGQENADWELRSGAVRRVFPRKDKTELQDLIKTPKKRNDFHERNLRYHEELLGQARLRGWHRESSGRELKDLELLAKLQHHGAATCLLDFTTRFDIAIWFACKRVRGRKDGKVFIVDLDSVPTLDLREIGSKDLSHDIGKFLSHDINEFSFFQAEKVEDEKKPKFWYWHPETLMDRMLSQESRFLFGSEDVPDGEGFSQGEYLFSITIREVDKKQLLEELKQVYGLSQESIISDIYGFAGNNKHNMPFQRKRVKDYRKEGIRKFQRGDFFTAIKNFNEVLKSNKRDTDVLFYRGTANFRLGKEKIRQYIRKLMQLNQQEFRLAVKQIGSDMPNYKHYEEAVKDFNRVIKLKPDYYDAYSHRSDVNAAMGNLDEAYSDLEKLRDLYDRQGDQEQKELTEERLQRLHKFKQMRKKLSNS